MQECSWNGWQQLHDHERESVHDTSAQVGESTSKWYVHFELIDHQNASHWYWWFCIVSFVTSSFFFWDDISEIRMIQNRQDQVELIWKSLCCWSLFHIAFMMMVLLYVCSSVRAVSLTTALVSINVHTRCLYRVRSTFDWTGRIFHRDQSSLSLVWTSHIFHADTATHTSSFVTFKSFDTWPTCTSLLCAWEVFGSASPKFARSVISDTKSNLCGWLNFCFPKQVLKGGQTVCFVMNLSWRSSSNLRVLVAMVQYKLSVTEKWRAGLSLVSCQSYQELSNASCLDLAWFGSR